MPTSGCSGVLYRKFCLCWSLPSEGTVEGGETLDDKWVFILDIKQLEATKYQIVIAFIQVNVKLCGTYEVVR